MSQSDQIYAYLDAGNTIMPAEAFSLFGTLALHSRIAELRPVAQAKGKRIEKEMVETNSGKRVGRYRLVGQMELL